MAVWHLAAFPSVNPQQAYTQSVETGQKKKKKKTWNSKRTDSHYKTAFGKEVRSTSPDAKLSLENAELIHACNSEKTNLLKKNICFPLFY